MKGGLYRKANPLRKDISKALIRMSWNRINLFNLIQRKMAPESSRSPLFKQRWVAKRETRAYHWDHITERQFLLRHFTPRIKLPDMGAADRHLYPPTAMLCYAELERRLDIVVHRCLFAPSVWAARALVVQGHVKVNGTTVTRPSTSLRDGDIITVDPAAIALLTVPKEKPQKSKKEDNGAADAPKAAETEAVVGGSSAEGEAASADTKQSADSDDAVEDNPEPESEKSGERVLGKGFGGKTSYGPNGLHESPDAKRTFMKETGKPLEFCEVPFMGPWMFVPEYLEVDYNICSAVFLRAPTLHPGRCEVPTPWPPEHHALTFEWYSRIYNRKTKRAPPEPLMIHGQPVRLKEKFVKIVEREARDRNAFFQRSLADAERERILETAKMVQSPARPAGSPSASL